MLLREAESWEQPQQQQPRHLEYIQPSPYSNFITVAHHTIVPSALPGHPSPSVRDAPSSCEFILSPPHTSPSCTFRLVLLPDHRAAIRSGVARCTFTDSSVLVPPALSPSHSAGRFGNARCGQGVGGGIFDVRDVTSFSVVAARLGVARALAAGRLPRTRHKRPAARKSPQPRRNIAGLPAHPLCSSSPSVKEDAEVINWLLKCLIVSCGANIKAVTVASVLTASAGKAPQLLLGQRLVSLGQSSDPMVL